MSKYIKEICDMKKESGGYSHSEKHSITFTWEINEITSFLKSARTTEELVYIHSPKFSTGARVNDFWYLQLKIKKDNESSKDKSWVSLYLMPSNLNRRIRTKYLLFIVNNKKDKIVSGNKIYNESSDSWLDYLFVDSKGYGFAKLIKIEELLQKKEDYCKNDTLTVGIELTVFDDYVANNNTRESLKCFKRKLSDDINDLFKSKKRCDVMIAVGDEKFNAHKFVLAARSDVFEAMFREDMAEDKESKITIPNVDSRVFKKVLDFIYKDEVDLDSDVEKLLEAADKYQLQQLKEICEDALSKTLTLDCALRILILAKNHNAKRLKESAIDYVVANFLKIKNTEEFKDLEDTQLSLFLIIVKRYLNIE